MLNSPLLIILTAGLLAFTLRIPAEEPAPAAGERPYEPVDQGLYTIIAQLDAEVFEAFNAGNLEAQKKYFDPSLEFYHDKGGLYLYSQFLENSEKLFARSVRPKRSLVPDSLEVYPITGYGAIQVGRHRFTTRHPDGQEEVGIFRFVHIWRLTGKDWRITRVISYDH